MARCRLKAVFNLSHLLIIDEEASYDGRRELRWPSQPAFEVLKILINSSFSPERSSYLLVRKMALRYCKKVASGRRGRGVGAVGPERGKCLILLGRVFEVT